MEAQAAPPAPPAPPALSTPAPAQIASVQATHTSPASAAQAAPPEPQPMPASPAAKEESPNTAPPAAPATSSAMVGLVHDVAGDVTVDDNASTRASIDSEAEERLTIEIVILWGDCKSANATARLMRAEGKPLRLALAEERKSLRWALAEKLYVMKAILVGTGREGRWAPYLREQGLPVASADRLVGEHQAKLTAPKDKLLSEELPVATVDDVRKLAKKMLPKLCRVLTTAELAFEFIGELFWNLDAAEGRETDDGVEVFRTSHEDDASDEDQAAESAGPAPTVS